jgi:hypothetical protein
MPAHAASWAGSTSEAPVNFSMTSSTVSPTDEQPENTSNANIHKKNMVAVVFNFRKLEPNAIRY